MLADGAIILFPLLAALLLGLLLLLRLGLERVEFFHLVVCGEPQPALGFGGALRVEGALLLEHLRLAQPG